MQRIMQTRLGDTGNCMSACLAMVLGLEIEQVPNFFDLAGRDSEKWWQEIRMWLRPRGYDFVLISASASWITGIGGALIVGGQTDRGTSHAVVYLDGKLFHDPHPDGTGLIEPEDVTLIYPIDPSAFEFKGHQHGR